MRLLGRWSASRVCHADSIHLDEYTAIYDRLAAGRRCGPKDAAGAAFEMEAKQIVDEARREREREEKSELERVLASGIFSKAPNLAKLLSYICDRYWEGEGDSIKEYRLGVEALGRRPDFDPSSNAIVRVEAHRLREKLRRYYENEGADHQLAVTLQAGRYAPQFAERGKVVKVRIAAPPAPRRRNLIPAVVASAIVAAGVFFILVLRRPRSAPGSMPPHRAAAEPAPKAALPASLVEARIRAGYSGSEYVDDRADAWSGDRDFSGGYARTTAGGLILRTVDPALFSTCRMGDFTYNIPLRPGDYQLWLYFVETFFGPGTRGGGGVTSRVFDVQANGRTLLNHFDIMSDAGGNFVADVRVFRDIHPAPDGYLHLVFVRESGDPLINAIKVEPGTPGKLLPIRIVAQDAPYTGPSGLRWSSDRYFEGGRPTHYLPVDSVSQAKLYTGERYGNFNYAIPVAPGRYTVTLYFCEHYFGPNEPGGGGAGSRVFNVFSDGTTLLKDFDIFKEADGWGRPIVKTFHDIQPSPQGKIDLDFDPVVNYALVNAISVVDEFQQQ